MASLLRPALTRASLGPVSKQLGRASNAPTASCSLVRPAAAGFHTSEHRMILPPEPQRIEGTVNDPAPIPSRHPSEGSYHWTFDRLLTVGLVPLTIAPLSGASLSPVMDSVLCGVLVLHCHTGFQSIITDYVPPRRLPKMAWLFKWGLRAATLTTAFGLYEFETNDVGLTEGIKRIWKA